MDLSAKRPLVKICGITNADDGRQALDCGADLLGFMLARSPRRVTAKMAARLIDELRGHPRGAGVLMTGVFMNAPLGWCLKVAREARFDLVQLHGEEDPDYVGKVVAGGFKVMKVIKKLGKPAISAMSRYPEAWAFLLEPAKAGPGMNKPENPRLAAAAPAVLEHPRVGVAGGVSAVNVAGIIAEIGPQLWMVDASSRLERFPGVKNPDLVRQLIRRAKGI